MSNDDRITDAWLAHHARNKPPNNEPHISRVPIRSEDMTYITLLLAGMNTDPDSYEEHIAPTFPEVIKSDPDSDMPKPDMDDGSYSTKQANLLIIYKQKQEGGVREEE